jgi:4-hydroxybenzoate polyprenyltransferase
MGAAEEFSTRAAAAPRGRLRLLLASMRPEQWVKNLLVLAALVFARRTDDPGAVARALQCLLSFVALSSAVYLWNDVHDRERDRVHPLKRRRPIASGAIGAGTALAAAAALAALGGAAAATLSSGALALALAYLLNNVLYTLWLRQEVILDVMSISAGFLLRAVAGAVAVGVSFSPWLLLCTLLLSLFLGLCKRRYEAGLLAGEETSHRRVLSDYSPEFLDQAISLVTASTLIAYSLYTLSPRVQAKLHSSELHWTIPIVLYGIFRYLYIVYHLRGGGDPSRALVTDRPLLASIGLWGAAVLYLLR